MVYNGIRFDGEGYINGYGYYDETIDLNGTKILAAYIRANSGWYRVIPDSVKVHIFGCSTWISIDRLSRSKPDISSVKFYERPERYEFIKRFGYPDTLRNIKLDPETNKLRVTFFGGGVKTITSAVEIAFLAEYFKIG